MTPAETKSKPETTVVAAPMNERTLVAGLMQRYLAEQSTHTGMKAEGNGRYRYPQLDLYWQEPGRHAYLIQTGRRTIGFALVREVPGGTTITEFFVASEHRRRGHGKAAVFDIFLRFPGKWAIREQITDSAAQAFWRKAIRDVDPKYGERIETTKDGRSVTVQRFNVSMPEISEDLDA